LSWLAQLTGKRRFQQPVVVRAVPLVWHGKGFVAVDETIGGEVMLGIVGKGSIAATVGDTLTMGTDAAELIPRLPISVDPNGIPVRAAPPGVMGVVDVGADDAAMLLEPEPHIPDNPEVSSIPEVVDIPDDVDIPDVAMVPAVAPVAGVAVPIPPPSKAAVDPNIPDGAIPMVEHVVPLLGIEIAPMTPEGAGLMPGDTISVAPRGMPVGETAEPVPIPSGEVASMVGVGLAIPVTCAMATLQKKSVGMIAATSEYLIGGFRFPIALLQRAPIDLAMVLLGGRLSDIAWFPTGGARSFAMVGGSGCRPLRRRIS
jgi:hypothetical protein